MGDLREKETAMEMPIKCLDELDVGSKFIPAFYHDPDLDPNRVFLYQKVAMFPPSESSTRATHVVRCFDGQICAFGGIQVIPVIG